MSNIKHILALWIMVRRYHLRLSFKELKIAFKELKNNPNKNIYKL